MTRHPAVVSPCPASGTLRMMSSADSHPEKMASNTTLDILTTYSHMRCSVLITYDAKKWEVNNTTTTTLQLVNNLSSKSEKIIKKREKEEKEDK
ncbi:Protein CBG25569 [Caenorhabditis briggsae]|uniref:Protein CBG25569 n=1 Tax=Caenorhabditis briggsae TaxID=6238 RepID=B6IF56_CAEBR|nr:Protein CBG25569 [Caenorhabditis briggsae]CAR98536.1 Protein CBG25569 [Caenorhabditis briggsae]